MAWTIKGRLDSTRSERAGLAACSVEVFFDQRVPTVSTNKAKGAAPGAAPASVAGRASASTDAQGRFEVIVPDKAQLAGKRLRFVVSAPSGHTIGEDSQDISRIDGLVRISVDTRKVEPIDLKPPKDVPQPQTRRVAGRVIERSGKSLPSSLQVLLFARQRGEKGTKTVGQDTPILVARTDGTGYFFGEIPNERYESAAALVTGVAGEIQVPLEDGMIPLRIALVIELPADEAQAAKDPDCECDGPGAPPRTPTQADIENAPGTYSTDLGTGCVRFNTPNRAIEEFSFYTVVRTTEPFIRGVTVGLSPVQADGGTPVRTAPPSTDESIRAQSYALELQTGERGTWGAIKVTLVTDDKSRYEIYSKPSVNAVGGLFPNVGLPELDKLVLKENVTVRVSIAVVPAINFDLRSLRSISIEWTPSNLGDAWALKGISLSAMAGAVRIPVLVNDMEQYIQSPQIALFGAIGAVPWIGSARIADRAVVPAAIGWPTGEPVGLARVIPRSASRIPGPIAERPLGRAVLDHLNPVDWDATPTFHEATTVAHGHLLHFKQVWYADGYSLGDLLYSLPLAPGQKKLISVVDWERRERTERNESTVGNESVRATLSRDRDLSEVVTGALTESSRGGSKNTTVGVGAGTGAAGNGSYQQFNFGALIGVSGGYGESNSDAWQVSARDLSSKSIQNLHDNTLQSASAVRGLRSSVVHTVSQGEAVRATTEVVANHNHCHAVTVQYFEVLRHLKLTHELADVQECLFVPLPMTEFDLPKLLRWAQPLRTYLQLPDLDRGFDAARRVATDWSEVEAPLGRYADEPVTSIAGELMVTVVIPLPPFPERPKARPEDTVEEAAKRATAMSEAINPTSGPLGIFLGIISGGATVAAGLATNQAIKATKEAAAVGARALADELFAQPTAQERYDKFHHEILPAVVESFVDQLELYALVNGKEVRMNGVDFTLVSEYQPAKPLLMSLRGSLQGQIPRAAISQLIIKSAKGLPAGCRAIINSATIRYRTRMCEHVFVDDSRVNDDIDLPKVVPLFTAPFDMIVREYAPGTGAALYTPTDAWEQRSPRLEDCRLAAQLVDHLNDNLEFYHHAIWWTMDPNRRFMLLDGYYAPGSDNRSIASVVENRLIGIVGNSFVLPVARGTHLDPRFRPQANGVGADLLDFYKLASPIPPSRVSLPTRGVFAEAVMGSCNSCEEIDDSKFWRWQDSPIDEPPSIEPISTSTRRTEPGSVLPSAFPTPIVSIQNAPAAPDPAGVRFAIDALGRQSFPDITGLAGTQANAAAAYSQALDTAFKFGKEASTLAQQAAMLSSKDKALGAIDKAEAEGKIDTADAKSLRVSALRKMVGDGSSALGTESVEKNLKVVEDAAKRGAIPKAKAQDVSGSIVDALIDPSVADRAQKDANAGLLQRVNTDDLTHAELDADGGANLQFVSSTGQLPSRGGARPLKVGEDAVTYAAYLLGKATTMDLSTSFGPVRLVPGSIWYRRRMLLSADDHMVYYMEADGLFELPVGQFLSAEWFGAAERAVAGSKAIAEFANAEVKFLTGLFVPWYALLGVTVVDVALKYRANRATYKLVMSRAEKLLENLNALRKSNPKLFRSIARTAVVDGLLEIPESFSLSDVAFFVGRIISTILPAAQVSPFGKGSIDADVARISVVVVAKALLKVSVILGSLHYPAGSAAALKAEAKKKAAELNDALKADGVDVDLQQLQDLIEEGARKPDTQATLKEIADNIDDVMPLLNDLSRVLSGPVPTDTNQDI